MCVSQEGLSASFLHGPGACRPCTDLLKLDNSVPRIYARATIWYSADSACMYVYMYIYMYMYMCVCMYVCIYVCMHVCMYACILCIYVMYVCYACMLCNVCMLCMYVMYVCYVCYVCMYVCMYVCIYVCMHACLFTVPVLAAVRRAAPVLCAAVNLAKQAALQSAATTAERD